MNFSLDFMGASLAFGANDAGPPSMAARVLRAKLRAREDDLDAPVARAAGGRRVRGKRVHRAVARGREAAGCDVVADEVADDGRGATGRELPVRRERAARDRLVVGVPLDHDRMVELRAQELGDAVEQRRRLRVERRAAAVVQHLVGEQADHEAAARDRRLELVGEPVRARVAVDLLLELLEVVVLLRLSLALASGVELLRDRLDGRDRRRRRGAVRVGLRAGLLDRLAAREDLAREGVLHRALQRLELRGVHGRDREQDHEQRHEQRDHVRVGEQPALVVLVLAVVAVTAATAASAAARAHQAASATASAPAAAPAPAAAAASSDAPLRSAGGMKLWSFSARMRGLSPAWMPRMPSSVSVRSSTSAFDNPASRLAVGRKMTFAIATP